MDKLFHSSSENFNLKELSIVSKVNTKSGREHIIEKMLPFAFYLFLNF